MRTLSFLFLCSIILLIPVTLWILIVTIHSVFAQGTPTATTTIQGQSSLPSSIQFIPQKAIITTLPPEGNSPNSGFNVNSMGGEGGIVGTVIGTLGLISSAYTYITKGRNIKALANQQVINTDVNLSQSKQFYDANKTYGDNLNGSAPETKIAKLQENKDEAVKLASKV